VLVAVGRKAPTADIGIQNVELDPGGFLEVDEHMRVRGVSWLYATSDINGRAQFTHKGTYQARIAVDHILGDRTAVADRRGGGLLAGARLADPRSIARGAPHAGRRHTLTP
jgi:pyruvate/2-oxoglutarate dehydrogenase complex dihydrolipoamide dehydrogenase (E3) component